MCGQESLNAFILQFAGDEGFFVSIVLVLVLVLAFSAGFEDEDEDENELASPPLVSQPKNRSRRFADPLKDQLMKVIRNIPVALALAGLFAIVSTSAHAQFAGSILSYDSGTGFAAGFTNASSALGSPALGSGVTPFSPPFSKSQLVSIGAGGEITLQMDTPIVNDPGDPFGLNFIIFANSFFVQNGGSGQNATTSGSLFFHPASALIQVSADDVNWYTLNPTLAPQPGEFFPTYGGGNPLLPANPSLANVNFAGMTLAQVESLYGGSAGGTGYSLSWAQDSGGNAVDLATADYVRIEVQSGVLDMDAVSAVPEPGTWALILLGGAAVWFWSKRAGLRGLSQMTKCRLSLIVLGISFLCHTSRANTITEDFSTDPLQNGWAIFGDTNLFQWDSIHQNLEVTWDSSQSNSYFYIPLGTTLGKPDAFAIDFDITLNDIQWSNTFQIAVGLLNFANATDPEFLRGAGTTPNIFEFDYFPDSGDSLHDPNVEASMTDATADIMDFPDFYFTYDNLAMQTGVTYHVTLNHAAGDAAVTGMMLTNGQIFTTMPIIANTFGEVIGDFALDTVSITSYSGAGQFEPAGSILAHGTLDNVIVTLPPTVRNFAGAFTNGVWQVQFGTYTGWDYTLERSTNLISWSDASDAAPGTGSLMTFSDTNALAGQAFYRVRAERP
ncbi:MAG TPA: PEP-CTERM sorting domain-containing protein [Verrucomicrobiae bacterium]|nr:PEP-CTERM sorting domain-containing protein [Verrucomicrobiae bacterium]